MANKSLAVVVRGCFEGKQVNGRLGRAKQADLPGTYWIKWRAGSKPQWAGPFKTGRERSATQHNHLTERSSNISIDRNEKISFAVVVIESDAKLD